MCASFRRMIDLPVPLGPSRIAFAIDSSWNSAPFTDGRYSTLIFVPVTSASVHFSCEGVGGAASIHARMMRVATYYLQAPLACTVACESTLTAACGAPYGHFAMQIAWEKRGSTTAR